MGGALEVGRRVVARAPVRVADVGGWTDTGFAGRGAVCSVAVGPGSWAEVRIGPGHDGDPVDIWAPDLGVSWRVGPGTGWLSPRPDTHPLLEHAIAATAGSLADGALGPEGASLEVAVGSSVPPGCAVGTSASVLVALVTALEAAVGAGTMDADHAAQRAYRVETEGAGRQSGIQDHVAAAHGGVSWIEVDPFPRWRRHAVSVPEPTRAELARRLVTIHLGGGHDSSVLHRVVIERAAADDAVAHGVLDELRGLAALARDQLTAGDLDGWAATLAAATQEQARLHPSLVGDEARAVLDLAAAHGCRGGKVNGAGGTGGTVTFLGPDDPDALRALRGSVAAAARGWDVLDLAPAQGVWVDSAGG